MFFALLHNPVHAVQTVTLAWDPSPDTNVVGYNVYYGVGSRSYTNMVHLGNVTNVTISGIVEATTYYFAATTYTALGLESDFSNEISYMSSVPDTTAPTVPTGLVASGVSANQISLRWVASTDNVGVTGYRVERSRGAGATSFAQVGTASGTNYSDTGLLAATVYSYRVRATDGAGNLSRYSSMASVTTSNASPVGAGLAAAYGFNEGTGTTVGDASGNGNSGTVSGTSWTTTTGQYGNALAFNGTSSYVNLGNPALLHLTGSMTLEAWVLATGNPPDDGQIIAKSDAASTLVGWQFKTSPDTGVRTFAVAVSPDGNSNVQRYSRTTPALNTWYHVAGVYNASAGALDIYVNGVLDDGVLNGTVPNAQFDPNLNVSIGRRGGGYYFNGTIDEVRVYNRALSQAEIQSDMNAPIGTALPRLQIRAAPARQVVLTVTGQIGHTYEILATQTFTAWTVLGTVTVGAGGSSDFTDTNAASYPKRCYRTREKP